jgi:hypothetical protein
MKTPYIYHPEEMFLPSGNWEIKTILDGTVTIIDNFYLNPQDVLGLAGKLAYTNHPDFTSAAPLLRSVFFWRNEISGKEPFEVFSSRWRGDHAASHL